tara:strand:- start:242 stop:388 length:147 start_codon:yes stop_codon:yes gene_type:complete
MMDQKQQIRSFIANIIDKNYATAHKNLKSVTDAKIKERITNAKKKDLF